MSVVDRSRTPPVRTPDPLSGSRRRALKRLGELRAMGLGAIGDIGSVAFATPNSVTWDTAADWDNATSESGVVHENTANTDHTNATAVKQGYPVASPILPTDIHLYAPLHEDSGSTVNDFSANSFSGTASGVTLGATGLLGTSCFSFDGTDDYVEFTNATPSDVFTIIAWFRRKGTSETVTQVMSWGDDTSEERRSMFLWDGGSGGVSELYFSGFGSGSNISSGFTVEDTDWHMGAITLDGGGTIRTYLDGATGNTGSPTLSAYGGTSVYFGRSPSGISAEYANIEMGPAWIYDGRVLTASEINSTYYDVVNAAGELVSDWKTLDADATTLITDSTIPASTSIDVTVEQDTNTDGTPENTQLVSLSGGSSENNALSGFSDTTGRYRVRIAPDNTDILSTAELTRATVQG